MNAKFSTRIKGKLYSTNESGRGVFVEIRGVDRQLVGTNDAQPFKSARQLNRWIHRHLDI